MRNLKTAPEEYYHILNRGSQKSLIFLDERDRVRFLLLLLYFQFNVPLFNLGRYVTNYVKHRVFNIILDKNVPRKVEIVAFCFMPNHFHLLVKENSENGIPSFTQRVFNAYTKYFNTKYKKSGHLFQGPYRIVHVKSNEQLLHLSAYIHRNPRELREWKNREEKYPWSSYQDYTKKNRWGDLLSQEIILEQFNSLKDYAEFLETSPSKEGVLQLK